ncbi:unnamed protein product [Sympodiomycopsis kandeliae]
MRCSMVVPLPYLPEIRLDYLSKRIQRSVIHRHPSMDFFKSSSSSSNRSSSKPSTSSRPKSNVVVSTVKRKLKPATPTRNGSNSDIRSNTATSNALPSEVRARIEAARAAQRERDIEQEAEAQIRKRPKIKAKKSSANKRSVQHSDSDDDDLFGSADEAATPVTSRKQSRTSTPSGQTPSTSAYTYMGRSGVKQPYNVPRPRPASASASSPETYAESIARLGEPISGASLVESAMSKTPAAHKQWGPFFKDIPASPPPRCILEYPAKGAQEEFILLVARDRDEYDPISDLLRSVYVIVKHYLTPEQRKAFGELDELETASAAGSIWTGPSPNVVQDSPLFSPGGRSQVSNPSTPIHVPSSHQHPSASADTNAATTSNGAPTSNGTPLLSVNSSPVGATSLASGSNTPIYTPSAPSTLETSSILRSFTKSRNRRSGVLFLHTVERFNTALRELRESGALERNIQEALVTHGVVEDVWTRVQDQAYARSVAPRVDELASYRSFSDNVYGELTPRFMSEIAQLCDLKPESTMVDLGCGVGNLVIQTGLQVGCTSVGVEYMRSPAELGCLQVNEAQRRWSMWNLSSSFSGETMSIWQGDFLEDIRIREYMRKADVVIVNNYAFTPPLNESLSLLFLDLPNNCKIISLKPFIPPDFRLTNRSIGSPSSILSVVQEREYGKGMVSWTERDGKYYIATVDRSHLQQFIQEGGGDTTPSKRKKKVKK